MKPKTKKILIIAAAIVAIAIILYFVFKGSKKTAKGMINRLSAPSDTKNAILGYLDQAKADPEIADIMESNNCSEQQAVAIIALYYLYQSDAITLEDVSKYKQEILAM